VNVSTAAPYHCPSCRPQTIYLARCGDAVKIGMTTNLDWRIYSLRRELGLPLVVARTVPGISATERWFHRRFADRRLWSEWFLFAEDMLTVEPGAEAFVPINCPERRAPVKSPRGYRGNYRPRTRPTALRGTRIPGLVVPA
jgi:hypothetical protein